MKSDNQNMREGIIDVGSHPASRDHPSECRSFLRTAPAVEMLAVNVTHSSPELRTGRINAQLPSCLFIMFKK